jgi:uncharacterized membrane protein YidH (DUF202 family)
VGAANADAGGFDEEARAIEDAAERGALSWQRTAIGLGAIGVVLLRRLEPFDRDRPLIGLAIIGLAVACALVGVAYRDQYRSDHAERGTVRAVTIATMIIGVLAFVLALFAH